MFYLPVGFSFFRSDHYVEKWLRPLKEFNKFQWRVYPVYRCFFEVGPAA